MEFLRDTLIYKIRGIRKKMVNAAKEGLADSGLTLELYVALHFIYENPGLSQKELSDLTWSDTNVVLRMVDKLESLNLVRREKNEEDRRAYQLFVTDEGEAVSTGSWEKMIQYQERCLDGLSAHERKDFKRFLDKVLDE